MAKHAADSCTSCTGCMHLPKHLEPHPLAQLPDNQLQLTLLLCSWSSLRGTLYLLLGLLTIHLTSPLPAAAPSCSVIAAAAIAAILLPVLPPTQLLLGSGALSTKPHQLLLYTHTKPCTLTPSSPHCCSPWPHQW
jgi:hypothetical protein